MTIRPILTVLAGSRAYGLEREDSDWDHHSVFVTPTADLLKLGPTPKDTHWAEGVERDTQSWEVGHFLYLATKCNPTVLETFVAPEVVIDSLIDPTHYYWAKRTGKELRSLFPYVLSRKRVLDAFCGYAHNQRAKLFKKPDDPTADKPGPRVWKFAAQYLRVLMTGERLLSTGELVVDMRQYGDKYLSRYDIRDAHALLREVRDGRRTIGRVIDLAAALEGQLKMACEGSQIADEPDLDAVNGFLLRVRKDHWW